MTAASKPESTAVTRVVEPEGKSIALRSKIGQFLSEDPRARAIIQPLLPRGLEYETVIAEAYRASVNNPDIQKCTPLSIINAIATVVETQLVIGKTIHLVLLTVKVKGKEGEKDTYEERLNAWTDYKGDIELVLRAGAARHIDGQCVYENDRFEPSLGTRPDIVHIPILDSAKRGKLIGAYAIAYLNGSGSLLKVVWMPLADINKIRANSRGWKHLPECPDWYAIKTAIHRVCKTLPKSDKLMKVLAVLDRQDANDREMDDAPLDPANRIESPATAASDEPAADVYPLRPREASTIETAATPAEAASAPAETRKRETATKEQVARLAELLDLADVDDEERERIAGRTYTRETADAQIAYLEKLIPQQSTDGNV